MTSVRYFLAIVFFLRAFNFEKRSIFHSLCHFGIGVAKNYLCEFSESFKLVSLDVGEILLFEAIHVNGTIIPLEEDDRPRAAGLPLARARNTLLDHPSTQIGINDPFVCEPCRSPQNGVSNACLLCETCERFALVNRQLSADGLAHI